MDCSNLQSQKENKVAVKYSEIFMSIEEENDAKKHKCRIFYYCLEHSIVQLNTLDGGRYEIVWPPCGETAFCDLIKTKKDRFATKDTKKKEYELIYATISPSDIAEKLREDNQGFTPRKACNSNMAVHIECPSDCDLGDQCINKKITKLRLINDGDETIIPGRVEVRMTENDTGKGLFSLQFFQESDYIIEYVGEAIEIEKERRQGYEYLMHLQGSCYLNARDKGNHARFINHSCEPNTEARKVIVSFL
jgi:hypothetical protein